MLQSIRQVRESRSVLFQDLEEELDEIARGLGAELGTYVASADAYVGDASDKPTDTPGHIVFFFDDQVKYINSNQYAGLVQRYRWRLMSITGVELPDDHILVTGNWSS